MAEQAEQQAERPERPIGRVTHFFGKISVAAIDLTDALSVGDTIHIKGHTTDLTLTVDSIQIEHQSVQSAKAGDCVGIKVAEHVREGDTAYRVG